jgi:hypothetical protein
MCHLWPIRHRLQTTVCTDHEEAVQNADVQWESFGGVIEIPHGARHSAGNSSAGVHHVARWILPNAQRRQFALRRFSVQLRTFCRVIGAVSAIIDPAVDTV